MEARPTDTPGVTDFQQEMTIMTAEDDGPTALIQEDARHVIGMGGATGEPETRAHLQRSRPGIDEAGGWKTTQTTTLEIRRRTTGGVALNQLGAGTVWRTEIDARDAIELLEMAPNLQTLKWP